MASSRAPRSLLDGSRAVPQPSRELPAPSSGFPAVSSASPPPPTRLPLSPSPADVLLAGLPRLDELVARSLKRLFELRVGRGEDRDDVAIELVVLYLFAERDCLCDACIVIDALREAVTTRPARGTA